jgi:threonine aldolase
MKQIDLRSDTVTLPTEAMRAVMAAAEVGDDVYGEDPSVNRLEAFAADLLGKEAALFVVSGTQGNLLGIMAHCERGDEYIVGQQGHTYKFEGGGAAVLGSIQPQPLDYEPDGTLDLQRVEAAIKPDDSHFARTRLLCLENTQGGKALPLDYLQRAHELARSRGLALHLDGARVFNAAVKQGVHVREIARWFDTVSVCLSKGLGAPVGSLLCGSSALIRRARRWRKVLGGGMRQAGVLAAAGHYALENNVARLEQDHANAAALAQRLSSLPGVNVEYGATQTNMVFLRVDPALLDPLRQFLKQRGILIGGTNPIRLVTHLDISAEDVAAFAAALATFLAQDGGTRSVAA